MIDPMQEIDCAHCGAKMKPAGLCPVCELPAAKAVVAREAVSAPESASAKLWRSGQAAMGLGALLLGASVPLPVVRDLPTRTGAMSVSMWDLLMGNTPTFRGRLAWVVPGAALFLLSLLRSRRTGSAMRASRPLAVVVSLAPIVAVGMPFALLHKHHLTASPGVGAFIALAGVALCAFAALRFGDGVSDIDPRTLDDD